VPAREAAIEFIPDLLRREQDLVHLAPEPFLSLQYHHITDKSTHRKATSPHHNTATTQHHNTTAPQCHSTTMPQHCDTAPPQH
jgi:hypothetical protein